MNTLLNVVSGAVSGVGGGAIAGMTGAFLVGFFSGLSRILDGSARLAVARVNVIPGALMGGIAGLLTGGTTGGSEVCQ